MQNFRTIKGTHDLLPNELIIWREVENFIHSIMQQNGYGEIRTPAFENTELFVRGIGTDSDIVTKEMYSWTDQGGNTLTLKPELTAPVARAYLQHQLGNQNPIHRLYYFDALFRRERPQKGRQRQFHQFGAEAIGSPNPEQDAEIIALAYNIYKKFNIQDMTVRLNSIGNAEIRPTYLETLRSYVKKIETELCSTCQTRIEKNALRLFDCKNPHCQELSPLATSWYRTPRAHSSVLIPKIFYSVLVPRPGPKTTGSILPARSTILIPHSQDFPPLTAGWHATPRARS